MTTSPKTPKLLLRRMTQKQIEAAANSDRDNRPLSAEDLERMKHTPQVKIIRRPSALARKTLQLAFTSRSAPCGIGSRAVSHPTRRHKLT